MVVCVCEYITPYYIRDSTKNNHFYTPFVGVKFENLTKKNPRELEFRKYFFSYSRGKVTFTPWKILFYEYIHALETQYRDETIFISNIIIYISFIIKGGEKVMAGKIIDRTIDD